MRNVMAAIDKTARGLQADDGICILSASEAHQKAYELKQENHSIFTYYLLQGLRKNNVCI